MQNDLLLRCWLDSRFHCMHHDVLVLSCLSITNMAVVTFSYKAGQCICCSRVHHTCEKHFNTCTMALGFWVLWVKLPEIKHSLHVRLPVGMSSTVPPPAPPPGMPPSAPVGKRDTKSTISAASTVAKRPLAQNDKALTSMVQMHGFCLSHLLFFC